MKALLCKVVNVRSEAKHLFVKKRLCIITLHCLIRKTWPFMPAGLQCLQWKRTPNMAVHCCLFAVAQLLYSGCLGMESCLQTLPRCSVMHTAYTKSCHYTCSRSAFFKQHKSVTPQLLLCTALHGRTCHCRPTHLQSA